MRNDSLRSLSHSFKANTDLVNVILILLIWMGMIVFVNPVGNFPLDDDWAYGWTVKTLLETGEYRLSDWTATNLLPQALWGTLFCLPFGFSFTALRISTLVLGLLGVLASYGLLREVKAHPSLALLGALVVALNPIYFGLSNSFNSDVPSFTFAILSLYWIVRGLRLDSNRDIIFGILISWVSILNRQSGIVVLLAFGLGLLVKRGIKIRTVVLAFLPALIGLLLQVAYSHWLDSTGKTPLLYGFQIKNLTETFSGGLLTITATYFKNAVMMSVYWGLFLFPFLLICSTVRFQALSAKIKRFSLLTLLLLLAVGVVLVFKDVQLPFVGNTLQVSGLGPEAFDGYSSGLSSRMQNGIHKIWKLLTLMGFAGAGILLLYYISALITITNSRRKTLSERWAIVLIGSAALLYFALIGGLDPQYWFDRYLIFPLPILMAFVTLLSIDAWRGNLHSGTVAAALALLLLYGSFTVAATHDYLSWNQSRSQALNDLTQNAKIPPERIYGGFEFNGWHFGNQIETCNSKYSELSSIDPNWGTFACLWGNDTDTYQYTYRLGFMTEPGYAVKQEYVFKRLLPPRKDKLYVLEKN